MSYFNCCVDLGCCFIINKFVLSQHQKFQKVMSLCQEICSLGSEVGMSSIKSVTLFLCVFVTTAKQGNVLSTHKVLCVAMVFVFTVKSCTCM